MFTPAQRFEMSLESVLRCADGVHVFRTTPYNEEFVRLMTAQAATLLPSNRMHRVLTVDVPPPERCGVRRLLSLLLAALEMPPLKPRENRWDAQRRLAPAYHANVELLVVGHAERLDVPGIYLLMRDEGWGCPVILAGDDRLLTTLQQEERLSYRVESVLWQPAAT